MFVIGFRFDIGDSPVSNAIGISYTFLQQHMQHKYTKGVRVQLMIVILIMNVTCLSFCFNLDCTLRSSVVASWPVTTHI